MGFLSTKTTLGAEFSDGSIPRRVSYLVIDLSLSTFFASDKGEIDLMFRMFAILSARMSTDTIPGAHCVLVLFGLGHLVNNLLLLVKVFLILLVCLRWYQVSAFNAIPGCQITIHQSFPDSFGYRGILLLRCCQITAVSVSSSSQVPLAFGPYCSLIIITSTSFFQEAVLLAYLQVTSLSISFLKLRKALLRISTACFLLFYYCSYLSLVSFLPFLSIFGFFIFCLPVSTEIYGTRSWCFRSHI